MQLWLSLFLKENRFYSFSQTLEIFYFSFLQWPFPLKCLLVGLIQLTLGVGFLLNPFNCSQWQHFFVFKSRCIHEVFLQEFHYL